MKPAVMAKRQEPTQREVKLPAHAIIFSLRNSFEEMVDDAQQLELLDLFETARQRADLLAN